MLLVDAANVFGSRPDGWWRDRPGAAGRLVGEIRAAAAAARLPVPVIVVVEGAARRGAAEGTADQVEVVHAPGSGDDVLAALRCGRRGSSAARLSRPGPARQSPAGGHYRRASVAARANRSLQVKGGRRGTRHLSIGKTGVMSTADPAALIQERINRLLAEVDPNDTKPEEFFGCRYDLGLAWVHFPEGRGGLGWLPTSSGWSTNSWPGPARLRRAAGSFSG